MKISQKDSQDFVLFPSHFTPSDMLALEPSRHQQSYFQHQPMDNSSMQDPFAPLGLDSRASLSAHALFAPAPHSFFDTPSFIVEAPPEMNKQAVYPSASPSVATTRSLEHPPSTLSTASGPSLTSASSSAVGSPYSKAAHGVAYQENWVPVTDALPQDFVPTDMDPDMVFAQGKLPDTFVDPSLIQPLQNHQNTYAPVSYQEDLQQYAGVPSPGFAPASPAHSHLSGHAQNQQPQHQQQQQAPVPISSPYLTESGFPQRPANFDRRSSISSIHSHHSQRSHQSPQSGSVELDEEGKEKGRCPHPDCGRIFKDLRAHMLTHQSERPEKCPIVNCEYHFKGFARKYDKNRHTLTHYKGTMVCGFCPGSGSAAEKSFNRADVFKRHLTSVHGVEQTPPNSRKKSPPASSSSGKMITSYCQDATGKCSTCSATFDNAQDFYEHLDDCVLRIVQQEDPSEAINEQRLTEVASDDDVKKTMEKHMLLDTADMGVSNAVDDENYNDENDNNDFNEPINGKSNSRSGKGSLKTNKTNNSNSRPVIGSSVTKSSSRAMTATAGGKLRPAGTKKRGNKNNYPPSWSCPANKMKAKKRVLCVYDGPRRLWKDEMMLDNEFEVRVKLPGAPAHTAGGEAYVTDLDVETLKRAEGVLNATEEEKGPWYGSAAGPQGLIGPAAVGIPPCTSAQEQMDEIDLKELMA